MRKLKASELREAFLAYFEKLQHSRLESASLIPQNDPTLLFTNAGMVPFKDVFLGNEKLSSKRVTSVQKCVRAGGKHNDLENVGFTARHFTFFEMLGNFSFGDYFKKEAIEMAWKFVTEELQLPKERLRVTVYKDDDEAAEIWKNDIGIPADKILREDEDNFWAMGDTGPCGPCSEIFWDRGPGVFGDRWVEIWNLVFMQYNRQASGELLPLANPCIDTGMGFERVCAVLQECPSNYEVDHVQSLIDELCLLRKKYTGEKTVYQPGVFDEFNSALRVIVDHLRSTSFLIADGVLPSNEGRGYVLRRILRRAIRFGKKIGLEKPFLSELFPALEKSMSAAYPELSARKTVIQDILLQEETKFFETLNTGLAVLEKEFAKLGSSKELPGKVSFLLYDSYGFPFDLTALIAKEKGIELDKKVFDQLMQEQRARAKKSWKGSGDESLGALKTLKEKIGAIVFTGYEKLQENSVVKAVESFDSSDSYIVIDPCPFYPEGGGQVGDQGYLEIKDQRFAVCDSIKIYEGGIALKINQPVTFKVGDSVLAVVDKEKRKKCQANHSATHLLHASLRSVLGEHVQQAGSYVGPDRLRFDFSHPKALTAEQLLAIENQVNSAIESSTSLTMEVMSPESAKEKGALALFGEKYGDEVRVVDVPGFSMEFCGGTHVKNTAEIRSFKIISEKAVASGTRRIEAITASGVFVYFSEQEKIVKTLSRKYKTAPEELVQRVERSLEENKELRDKIKALELKSLSSSAESKNTLSTTYKGIACKIHRLPKGFDPKLLRQRADQLRAQEEDALHILRTEEGILLTSKNQAIHSGNILKELAEAFGGRGGGQAQTAQGKLSVEDQQLMTWIKEQK